MKENKQRKTIMIHPSVWHACETRANTYGIPISSYIERAVCHLLVENIELDFKNYATFMDGGAKVYEGPQPPPVDTGPQRQAKPVPSHANPFAPEPAERVEAPAEKLRNGAFTLTGDMIGYVAVPYGGKTTNAMVAPVLPEGDVWYCNDDDGRWWIVDAKEKTVYPLLAHEVPEEVRR